MGGSPRDLQRDYYAATAEEYHREYATARDEHSVALSYISMMVEGLGLESMLDVGAGTGRGVKHFLENHPAVEVRGIEPVREMIDTAERLNGVPSGVIEQAVGERLPFESGSFDAACEIGVLHHVERPQEIVAEMTRVARRAVFISDENRFGRGSMAARLTRYGLARAGLWNTVRRLRTRGRGYHLTVDGGLAYSYSVYDSLTALQEWADRVFLIPTVPAQRGRHHPLLTASHVLVCAIRDDL